MKFSTAFLAVAAFVGFTNAQSACLTAAEAIPSCGQACLTSAASSQGCMFTDFACQCSNSAAIHGQALTACVSKACTASADVLAVSSQAQAVCGCVASAGPVRAVASQNAAIPSTTHAIPVTGAPPTNNAAAAATPAPTTAAPKVSMQSAGAAATTALSKFTGGAAVAGIGSVGGVMAAVLGLIAAL